jgi:hypothetical protein
MRKSWNEHAQKEKSVTEAGRFPIEAGHILMFARAIGDPNPAYDFTRAAGTAVGHVIAPPTFMRAGVHFDPA